MAGFPEAQTLTKLNQAGTSSPEVLNDADLKTRIVATDSYVIGSAPAPAPSSTPSCACCPARSMDAKRDLSDLIAAVLRQIVPRPKGVLVQLSVELVDMIRVS